MVNNYLKTKNKVTVSMINKAETIIILQDNDGIFLKEKITDKLKVWIYKETN